MKKVFFIGLAAATMLASCSNDETVEMAQNSKAIGFSSFVDKSTRAIDTDNDNLGTIEVYGWRTMNGADAQIFNAQPVTVTNGEGSYSPLQYWEPNCTYAFEGIAPKSGEKGVTFAAAKTGGAVTFTSDAETDLVYAGVVGKTTGTTVNSNPGKVNFTFKHLLSRVKFTFKNTFPSDAAAKISVKDVKIEALVNGSITPATDNAAWTLTGDAAPVSFASDDVADLVAGTGIGTTEHKYLIPNAAPQYKLTFTVVLDQNGATTEYPHTATIMIAMAKGMSYNFIASLSDKNVTEDPLFPIEFTADVDPWGEPWEDNDITTTPVK